MKTSETEINMAEVMSRITVKVKVKVVGVAKARLRLWIAARIFALGALVSGCAVEIDTGRAVE